ncbi:triose-phosphate isomerase [Marivita sp. XM-24bin2]|jgi:triosephosphate isomerase|uniref:triose-phosphate isomerase n=1 Tax=unclassified Marivita TaxID=2632480 RepID=UPI000D7B8C7A|nr:triose-phosphate isomerase [Marivita sp. XM-24bin2]MCR9110383.1 triose-phosphate isomerase [Paracoccaceae bacterium]PWL36061.1 MAG: triose-phosphate isomerase [Marivita sp. XM-24bin2]
MRRKLAAGNWKMNGTTAALDELDALQDAADGAAEVLICPPATLVASAAAKSGKIAIGGQDCHSAASGAHTGDVSAAMLKDAGAAYVILGHSERRADHGESDALVAYKTQAAWTAGLTAIVCVGETLDEREGGKTLDVVGRQLAASLPDDVTGANTVIAYEPVWAIGTGKVPTTGQIAEVHNFMRATLIQRFGNDTAQAIRLLYGGSVKASNATEIFAVADVDGALVGGASLTAADFAPIVTALNG